MLLKELLKQTRKENASHADISYIESALMNMKETAEHINNVIKKSEAETKAMEPILS